MLTPFLRLLNAKSKSQDSLGLKGSAREATYNLPSDQKQYLMQQNKDAFSKASVSKASSKSTHVSKPSQSATYGPSSGATHSPLTPQLTGNALMKRFSIVGWRAASPTPSATSEDGNHLNTDANTIESSSKKPQTERSNSIPPLQPQSTGSLWSSWWATSGGEKGPAAGDKGANNDTMRSPSWYVSGIQTGKATDPKLAKHLISMRVHLSTATLLWIEEFLVEERGMDALGDLLTGLVGKGGKRKTLSDVEATVLLEVIKCMRVLLNTEVSECTLSCRSPILTSHSARI